MLTAAAAIVAGVYASVPTLVLLLGILGAAVLMKQLQLGLFAVVGAALFVPLEISTGTEVSLNAVALLIPAVGGLWFIKGVRRRTMQLVPSRANRPLLLFLVAGLLSLIIGNALWDLTVPRSDHFILVQLAQWALFAFSAGAFLLSANLIRDERTLRRLTFFFLAAGGTVVLSFIVPGLNSLVTLVTTVAFIRVPFWMLLTALAAGQLLFNGQLSGKWQIFLLAVIGGVLVYSFGVQQQTVSNWLSVVTTVAVLVWFRWPRLRWFIVLFFIVAVVTGSLFSAVYEFAGGDLEWQRSGGSRGALITRVLELTWTHNPITGLGPAAYRPYGYVQPLVYGDIVWLEPRISSHNNYVDIVAHTGVLGLALFLWFCFEVGMTAVRLRSRVVGGFAAGYVNGMVAAGVGAMVIMALADWVLPFIYNIGFQGFQASVLLWLFMGGLVALERLTEAE